MNRYLRYYLLAAAVLVVVVVVFGVPTSSLWILGFVVLCPLMMIAMMWGMRGGNDHSGNAHGGNDRSDGQSRYDPTDDRDRHSWPRP